MTDCNVAGGGGAKPANPAMAKLNCKVGLSVHKGVQKQDSCTCQHACMPA